MKPGDKFTVKSLGWYNANKDKYGYINIKGGFTPEMAKLCGKVVTVRMVLSKFYFYIEEDKYAQSIWTLEMVDDKKELLYRRPKLYEINNKQQKQ